MNDQLMMTFKEWAKVLDTQFLKARRVGSTASVNFMVKLMVSGIWVRSEFESMEDINKIVDTLCSTETDPFIVLTLSPELMGRIKRLNYEQ